MSDMRVPPAIAKIAPDGNLTPRQKRRFMIDMVKRRIRPGAGSAVEFLQRRTADNPWPDLRNILQGIQWVVVGKVATRAYMPEQMTQDLDILVKRADGDEVIARLKAAGYVVVSRGASGHSMRSPDGVAVDMMFGDAPWLASALEDCGQDPAGYPVLSLPYLVLMQLTATRIKDWADLPRMLGWASDAELDEVRAVVARYSPEDKEELESLTHVTRRGEQAEVHAEP